MFLPSKVNVRQFGSFVEAKAYYTYFTYYTRFPYILQSVNYVFVVRGLQPDW